MQLEYVVTRIVHALLAIAAAIIFLLSFLVVADVIGRGAFNSPVKGTPDRRPGATGELMARIFIGSGRLANMRPADLVGAIVNEAGLDAQRIGSIEIADRFSFVEVPEEVAAEVVAALRSSTIKGRKVTVRPAD